jgi:hypothetical protein
MREPVAAGRAAGPPSWLVTVTGGSVAVSAAWFAASGWRCACASDRGEAIAAMTKVRALVFVCMTIPKIYPLARRLDGRLDLCRQQHERAHLRHAAACVGKRFLESR